MNGRSLTHIPKYTIDLSLPPTQRYRHVARDYQGITAELPCLFDELVRECLPSFSINKVKIFSRLTLRRLFSGEENEELQGICQSTGIEFWLLVAFNVLLDLFMGCTSGGVRVESNSTKSRMLHFRTLDWGMDPLRKIIVHFDYVNNGRSEVIASSIGYFGYVGILTGVRKGLSMSLNFRPNHDQNGRVANYRFYFHVVLVLLGFRPSISSLLRQCLLPSNGEGNGSTFQTQGLASIERTLPRIPTTAAYLVFSDGDRTIVVEKDNRTAIVRSADDFITVTNHDTAEEDQAQMPRVASQDANTLSKFGMAELVEESMSRKAALVQKWQRVQGKPRRRSSRRLPQQRTILFVDDVAGWMEDYPIANEETHFATVMDPKAGTVIWAQRYAEPLD